MIKEITAFLKIEGNSLLLIQGDPGTGKTILSLEIITQLKDSFDGIYFTSRVDTPSLIAQFPWIKTTIAEDKIIDTTKTYIRRIKKHSRSLAFNTIQDFLQSVYLLLEDLGLEKRKIFVIDSIEAISENLNIPILRLVTGIQDVAANTNSVGILISEKAKHAQVEYLSDGIITLEKKSIKGQIFRRLFIEKLRGVKIENYTYYFTLKDGRFKTFEEFPSFLNTEDIKEVHPVIKDNEGTTLYEKGLFSTGDERLDKIIGGYRRGSFVVFKALGNTTWHSVFNIAGHTIENFLAQNRGVIIISVMGYSPSYFKEMLSKLVGEEKFLKNTRVITLGKRKNISEDWLLCVEPTPEAVLATIEEKYNEFVKRFGNVLILLGIDVLETYFGHTETEKVVMKIISSVKIDGNLAIGMVTTDLKSASKIRRIGDYIFNVFLKNGKLFMYGIYPPTKIINVSLDRSSPHPKTVYIEVV